MNFIDYKEGMVETDGLKFDEEILSSTYNSIIEKVSQNHSMIETPNREHSLSFCKVAPNIPQFREDADFFNRRYNMIENARVYRFKDDTIKNLILNNKNEIGFRNMPYNNIFLEVFIDFGVHQVTGIHILSVKYDKDMNRVYYDNDPELEDGISIFITGVDKSGVAFFNQFQITKDNQKVELAKKESPYACPFCNQPMKRYSENQFYCDTSSCLDNSQNEGCILYDESTKEGKRLLRTQIMKDVWSFEDDIRLFVCNFLDFITNPEVSTSTLYPDLEKRNSKRQWRGKNPLPDTRVIYVNGYLNRYLDSIKRNTREKDIQKREQWVDGHFYRFWNREKWHNLYDSISKCKKEEDIRKALSKIKRRDKEGRILPDSLQYQWDNINKVIKIWKLPTVRNKGESLVYREKVYVVKSNK